MVTELLCDWTAKLGGTQNVAGTRALNLLARVAGTSPDCDIAGFDAWITPYSEVENPGPEFVAAGMQRLGHRGNRGSAQCRASNRRGWTPGI